MEDVREPGDEEFWNSFQKRMNYTDEQLASFRADPQKAKVPQVMGSPRIRRSTLVLEVVESHGCAEGMEAGDKLYFTGLSKLDPQRSSPWCAYALPTVHMYVGVCQNLLGHGLDPNDMYWPYFGCIDCGFGLGWGQVKMKAYVIEDTPDNPSEQAERPVS